MAAIIIIIITLNLRSKYSWFSLFVVNIFVVAACTAAGKVASFG